MRSDFVRIAIAPLVTIGAGKYPFSTRWCSLTSTVSKPYCSASAICSSDSVKVRRPSSYSIW